MEQQPRIALPGEEEGIVTGAPGDRGTRTRRRREAELRDRVLPRHEKHDLGDWWSFLPMCKGQRRLAELHHQFAKP